MITDQPKTCPGCGGEMRGDETAYPCGRKPVPGSLETTQCVRHQLFDARAKVAEIRDIADRLAGALRREVLNCTGSACNCREIIKVLDDYRKAVKP